MMTVPSCVTEELLNQDKEVLEDSRMTKWNTEKQKSDKGSTGRETTPRQIYQKVRECPNEALCERTTAVLQLSEVWPPVQDLQVLCPDLQVLRWKTRIEPVQVQKNRTLKCVNYRPGHATTSRLCPKKLEAENKSKTSHTPVPKIPIAKHVNRNPIPIPLKTHGPH